MKRKILFMGMAGILSLASCKDFLAVDSPSKFEDPYVYASEEDMFRAVTGIYAPLNTDDLYSHKMNTAYIPNTDVEFNTGSAVVDMAGNSFVSYESLPISTSVSGTWNQFYRAVDIANSCISGIENSELYKTADKTIPSNVTHMYGEAKTLRAFLYLDMIRLWGDIPFRTTSATAESDFMVGPTDRNEILSFLINDLISVEPMMKYASEISGTVERASKEFCQGMIVRMALTRGGWSLRPNKSDPSSVGYMDRESDWRDYYQIAEKYAYKIITEGKHTLKKSFRDIWVDECNWNPPVDDDIIFDVALLRTQSSEFTYSIGIPMADENPYGRATGKAIHLAGTYLVSFDEKDLRRDMTCATYSYTADVSQTMVSPSSNTNIKPAKWCKGYMKEPQGTNFMKGTGVNNTIMRYADILLMYAEAANENHDGPTPEAIEAFKTVRRRAFAAEDWGEKVDAYVESFSSREDFFMALVDERKWEFGGECIRRYDLPRWNLYSKTIYQMYQDIWQVALESQGLGSGEYDWFPQQLFYQSVPNPKNPNRTILDIRGIKPRLFVGPPGYQSAGFGSSFGAIDKETGELGLAAGIKYAFRGYAYEAEWDALDPNNLPPLRYLLPYPSTAIADHKGKLVNYYGFQ